MTTKTSVTSTSLIERDRQAIYASYGLTCPPRFATLRDPSRPTYGGKVARIAARLGTPLMPWQRYVADTALEIDPATGLFVYRKIGCTVPRQSGKTSLILPVCCHRGMAWPRQTIVYTAQSGTAAREKWEDDHVAALQTIGWVPQDKEPLLPKHRARVRKANGREAIIWRRTGSKHGLHANTERSGHGKTLHLGMLDEYFAQVDYRIAAAWSPAMITVETAQSWWFSTAGTSRSVPMNADIEHARALVASGEPSRAAYFDWSAPEKADYTDPRVWLRVMPALCPGPSPCHCSPHWRHTMTLDSIRGELDDARSTPGKLAEWLRAYMNWTRDDDQAEADPNVPTLQAWDLLACNAHAPGGELLACGIDVTPRRDYACIHAAGESRDGLTRLVVLEHGPGVDWVVSKAAELKERLKPVAWVLDDKSPAGTLIQPLSRAGIKRMGTEPKRGELWVPTTTEYCAACGAFADAVRQATIVHLGQPEMSAALSVARTRLIGDGAWGWGRRLGAADITPLVSGTLALAAFERFRHLAADYDVLNSVY